METRLMSAVQGRAPHAVAAREAGEATEAGLLYARAELNHRLKNGLAVALSLATQTGRYAQTVPEFMAAFSGRLQALSKAYELTARADWRPVALRDLVRLAVDRVAADGAPVEVRGEPDDLTVEARAAVSLVLVLHELATNAAKFGGLSEVGRRLGVRWILSGDVCELTWEEELGREVAPPRPAGAGLLLVARLLKGDLGGDCAVDFAPKGVKARLTFDVNGATA